jgi:hypothetical protein
LWRVFLSHTSELREQPSDYSFVTAAETAVIRAGHAIMDMAYFAARDCPPRDACRTMLRRSDVLVAIVGDRYGSNFDGRSCMEYEFDTATTLGLARLVFLIEDSSAYLRPVHQSPEDMDRQNRFRARLLAAGITLARVTSPTKLELMLYQALVELESDLKA